MNTERAGQNVDKKGFRDYVGEGRDVYESSLGIQERARNMYIRAARKYEDVAIIDCMDDGMMRPREAISEDVMNELYSRGLLKNE